MPQQVASRNVVVYELLSTLLRGVTTPSGAILADYRMTPQPTT